MLAKQKTLAFHALKARLCTQKDLCRHERADAGETKREEQNIETQQWAEAWRQVDNWGKTCNRKKGQCYHNWGSIKVVIRSLISIYQLSQSKEIKFCSPLEEAILSKISGLLVSIAVSKMSSGSLISLTKWCVFWFVTSSPISDGSKIVTANLFKL